MTDQLGDNLLRLKGNIRFAEGPRFVSIAGGRMTDDAPCENLNADTAFVIIAWQITREDLIAAVNACTSRP